MAQKVHLICIDDQVDFTDPNGRLSVPGGEENVKRIARMIERLCFKIADIHVTMDSHHKMDISHPLWWMDSKGKSPDPFTLISPKDVEDGVWTTRVVSAKERSLKYLKALADRNRYPHVIWPEHCLIGDPGHNLHPVLAGAIHMWEEKRLGMSDVVTKGSNPWTEHFSAVMAEVPDPQDPSTQINRPLIDTLEQADLVLWTGEALSHCVANTFRDTINNFSDPSIIKKMVLLTDATSSVPTFEKLGEDFIRDMLAKGMRTSTTVDILS